MYLFVNATLSRSPLADEIAIPFGVTVDFQSLKDRTATVRERNSMQQIRLQVCREEKAKAFIFSSLYLSLSLFLPSFIHLAHSPLCTSAQIADISGLVSKLASGSMLWEEAVAKHGLITPPAEVKVEG